MSITTTAKAARSRPRVAVAPADHVYVDRVVDRAEVDLVPAPTGGLVAWLVDDGSGRIDVLHLHVGLARIGELESVRAAARAMRLPLVVTLHNHPDLGHHDSSIGELCRQASAVVVHDPADAGVLRQRWDVEAYVQPYPHVADLAAVAAAAGRDRRPPWRVGIAPSVVPDDSREVARAALERIAGERDDVVVASDGVDVDDPGHVAAVEWLTTLDAVVLAGPTARRAWLELARDVGAGVIAPTAPAVVEPGVVATYSAHGTAPLQEEIARAVARACGRMPAVALDVAERRQECNRVRAAHTALYRAVTAATGASPTDKDHDERQDRRTW